MTYKSREEGKTMTLLDRLQSEILAHEINSDYEIWEGCYTDGEYDFRARAELIHRYPELDWRNPEHENMLLEMALDSHARRWKPEFAEGGWTREGLCLDGLAMLYNYYEMWIKIVDVVRRSKL